ncbi:hypothetical protein [Dolichospermum sp. UHCC 0259]|uniref:hypothetical protein n=1 Tax=Dolichospermum sp. UHCC 0259 TaxID=2590010 RepID=UPI001444F021|nr:hypothetical protein [Dolichospermum sp. UHCC 0259]
MKIPGTYPTFKQGKPVLLKILLPVLDCTLVSLTVKLRHVFSIRYQQALDMSAIA